MAATYKFRRSPAAYRPRTNTPRNKAPATRWAPPPAYLINAVLEHADLRDPMGDGKLLLRVSPAHFARLGLTEELGPESARLCDIAVLWDDREDEIIRVLDGSGSTPRLVSPPVMPDERDTFVLTPEAEAYLAGKPLPKA